MVQPAKDRMRDNVSKSLDLAASRPVAPRIAFCDQEEPAIAPRYLTAAIASGAAVLSVDHEKKVFRNFAEMRAWLHPRC